MRSTPAKRAVGPSRSGSATAFDGAWAAAMHHIITLSHRTLMINPAESIHWLGRRPDIIQNSRSRQSDDQFQPAWQLPFGPFHRTSRRRDDFMTSPRSVANSLFSCLDAVMLQYEGACQSLKIKLSGHLIKSILISHQSYDAVTTFMFKCVGAKSMLSFTFIRIHPHEAVCVVTW